MGAAGVAYRGAPDWGEPRRWGSGEAIGMAAGSHGAVQQKQRRCGTEAGGGASRRAQMATTAGGVATNRVQRRQEWPERRTEKEGEVGANRGVAT